MGNAKKAIFTVAVILLVIISLCAVFYGRVAVSIFAGSNNLNISYNKLQAHGLTDFVFTGLKVTQRKSGMGFFSSNAKVRLLTKWSAHDKTTTEFVLNNVHFITGTAVKEVSYNSIDGLVAMPFSDIWNYSEVSGKVSSAADGLYVNDFKAVGDSIKLSFSGLLTRDNRIKADIDIDFEGKLIGKMPPELTDLVLKDSAGGWKNLSIKLEGDLSKPSIQVTGKLFRLNIGLKEKA